MFAQERWYFSIDEPKVSFSKVSLSFLFQSSLLLTYSSKQEKTVCVYMPLVKGKKITSYSLCHNHDEKHVFSFYEIKNISSVHKIHCHMDSVCL